MSEHCKSCKCCDQTIAIILLFTVFEMQTRNVSLCELPHNYGLQLLGQNQYHDNVPMLNVQSSQHIIC